MSAERRRLFWQGVPATNSTASASQVTLRHLSGRNRRASKLYSKVMGTKGKARPRPLSARSRLRLARDQSKALGSCRLLQSVQLHLGLRDMIRLVGQLS